MYHAYILLMIASLRRNSAKENAAGFDAGGKVMHTYSFN
jgi:hypothetical protein